MQHQAQGWADQMMAGALPKQLSWLNVATQFYPQVVYGIACSLATFAELSEVHRNQY